MSQHIKFPERMWCRSKRKGWYSREATTAEKEAREEFILEYESRIYTRLVKGAK